MQILLVRFYVLCVCVCVWFRYQNEMCSESTVSGKQRDLRQEYILSKVACHENKQCLDMATKLEIYRDYVCIK